MKQTKGEIRRERTVTKRPGGARGHGRGKKAEKRSGGRRVAGTHRGAPRKPERWQTRASRARAPDTTTNEAEGKKQQRGTSSQP